jgi:hypothetical protein
MRTFVLPALALLAILYAPCVASLTVADTTSEVPFSFDKGFVIVQARIKNDIAVEVILATGLEHSKVDGGMLKKFKLPGYYSAEAPITGRNDRLYSFTSVPDIRVGDLKVTSLNMRLGSLADVSKNLGREIFGIFGADFFKGRIVQFDFKNRVIRFLAQSLTNQQDNKVGAAKTVMLPILETDDPLKRNVTLPLVDNITLDGKKIKMLLDTGMVTVIALSSSSAKKLGLQAPPDKGAPRVDKIKSVLLSDYELNDVPVVLYAKDTIVNQNLSEYGAVLGSVFLQNFTVTFDFRKKFVALQDF